MSRRSREAQALGIRASVGCPITVDGRLWGVIAASTERGAFPADAEARVGDFHRARRHGDL